MNVLDLFCGCGGISLGFKLAGYNIVGGVDINEDAINTFNHNFINAKGVCANLEEISDEEIEKLFLNVQYINDIRDIDIVVGGPPCQGFSTANRYNLENDDPRNKLFLQFIRVINIIRPRAILMENVKGIITRNNGHVVTQIYEFFQQLGYQINHKVLNAADFGVPQRRERAFFVALRDVDEPFNFDDLNLHNRIVTVDDAIGELYELENQRDKDIYYLNSEPNTDYRRYLRNETNSINNHLIRYPSNIVQQRISYVPQGGNWMNIPQHMFENNRNNRHSSAYKRLNQQDVSCTIDTGNAHSNYFHPLFNRIPTVREAARLQSFHDGFIFTGSRTSQYRQVGNAVPPLLIKAIAEKIRSELLNE